MPPSTTKGTSTFSQLQNFFAEYVAHSKFFCAFLISGLKNLEHIFYPAVQVFYSQKIAN